MFARGLHDDAFLFLFLRLVIVCLLMIIWIVNKWNLNSLAGTNFTVSSLLLLESVMYFVDFFHTNGTVFTFSLQRDKFLVDIAAFTTF